MRFARLVLRRAAVAAACFASAALGAAAPRPIMLEVDAREAPKRIFHARLSIPASPGTLRLYYPKWIPGEHGPTGPITDLAGLKLSAAGKPIPWRRDLRRPVAAAHEPRGRRERRSRRTVGYRPLPQRRTPTGHHE